MFIINIKPKKILISLLFVIVLNTFAQQSNNISGRIVDSSGRPIELVEVSAVNEINKTITDINGEFVITSEIGKTLEISKSGYKSIKIEIKSLNVSDIKLESQVSELFYDVAYGKRQKLNLTSSISVVSADALSKVPVSTLGNAIQGLASGLTVLRTVGAEPGWDQPNIYIRGIQTFGSGRSPLVMVDNVERDFTQLDPEEIESLTILKDAAATALYGMRGANGVILVTTKRGYVGKTVISLTAQSGTQSATRLPKYTSSADFVKYRNLALRNDYNKISDDEFSNLFLNDPKNNPDNYNGSNPFLYPNTNWHDNFIKSAAPQQTYRLSFRGGGEIAQYYLMLGVLDQEGLYNFSNENKGFSTQNKFTRYNIRSVVDVNISDNFKVGINLGGRVENRHTPGTAAHTIISALSKLPATMPVFNEDKSIAGSSVYNYNPYGMIAKSGFQDRFNRNLQGTVTGSLKLDKFVKGLSASALFGFDAVKEYARSKGQSYAVFQQNADNTYTQFGEESSISLGFSSWGSNYSLMLNYQYGLSFDRVFANNHIQADLNYMQSSLTVDGNNPDYRNQGVFGRATYTYDKRYTAEFGFAYNGSENFAKGARFGFFPTASAAWTISNEDFLSDNNIISFLKLRGSYGKVGNSNIGIGYRYPFEENFYLGRGYYFGTGGSDGAYEGRIPNSSIVWEESLNTNIGVEIGLFNKLYLEMDFFNNNRSNIITGLWNTLPSYVGQDLPYVNSGSVLTNGFELSLKHENSFGDFGYMLQGSVSFARNKITAMQELAGMNEWEYQTGRAVNQLWGLEVSSDKFFKDQTDIDNWPKSTFGTVQAGDVKYVDQNNDGIIDNQDNVPIGKPTIPELNFGVSLGLNYKGFDISALVTGIANRSLFITNNIFMGMQDNNNITYEVAQNSWGISDNPIYPRLTTLTNTHNYRASNLWLKDLDFLRIQTLEFGYNVSTELLKKINISKLRFYVNGYNLFSFDNMKKYNVSAEIPNAGVSMYPETRVINVGANIQF